MPSKLSSRKQWQFHETPMVVAKNADHPLSQLSMEQLAESRAQTLAAVLAAIARRKFLGNNTANHSGMRTVNTVQDDRQVA